MIKLMSVECLGSCPGVDICFRRALAFVELPITPETEQEVNKAFTELGRQLGRIATSSCQGPSVVSEEVPYTRLVRLRKLFGLSPTHVVYSLYCGADLSSSTGDPSSRQFAS